MSAEKTLGLIGGTGLNDLGEPIDTLDMWFLITSWTEVKAKPKYKQAMKSPRTRS